MNPVIIAPSTGPSRTFVLNYSYLNVSARFVSWLMRVLRLLRVVGACIVRDGFSRILIPPAVGIFDHIIQNCFIHIKFA